MSLAGLRDISVIETPPEGRRPVRTYVGPYDEELVRRAIEREIAREGQAFFLHNRIDTLPDDRRAAARAGPRRRAFAEAHGQMDEARARGRRCSRFLRGDADCLVATTIIESGLDIPQANTLIVERADQLGLAQAYQIRGRVGRSRERAFAYMLYPSEEAISRRGRRPAGDALRPHRARLGLRDRDARPRAARRRRPARRRAVRPRRRGRLRALRRAARRGGRGAARRRARAGAPTEAPVRLDIDVDAFLPADYVPFEAAKIDVHRRIAGARRAGRAARAARRAARPLRPGAGAGREPARAPARADRARRRGRAHRRGPRRAALDHAARARRRDRSAASARRSRRRSSSSPPQPLSLRVPDDPDARAARRGARALDRRRLTTRSPLGEPRRPMLPPREPQATKVTRPLPPTA